MITLNPFDVFLWTLRRNEKDVVNLYNTLSPVMQVATGGSMLNFGYWDDTHKDPISAQENLCSIFANMAELDSAQFALDVGSGLSAPAIFWRNRYEHLFLTCVNINRSQLSFCGREKNIEFTASSSTLLPFAESSVDRILALESAQHFKPLSKFVSESRRVLSSSGILAMAIPVVMKSASISKLGILKFTWSSEHYGIENIRNVINNSGFRITEEIMIGSSVYEPLANFYLENHNELKKLILKQYSPFVESVLFRSIQKMAQASKNKIIEYVLLKCKIN